MDEDDNAIKQLRIIAVDDDEANLLVLKRLLERDGYEHVHVMTDPSLLPELLLDLPPDLVVLDLHMPGTDGLQLMERLKPLAGDGLDVSDVPFLVLTADVTDDAKRRALSAGASDFLTKPLDRVELLLRVRNLLKVKHLQDRLRKYNTTLEHEVAERTQELEHARTEVLERLALAAEYRDDETQEHAWRIGRTCAMVATQLGLDRNDVELLERAAPLHDLGKIGIPDEILLKPGALTDAEFEVIKTHTTIGAGILAGSRSPVLRLAERIAVSHHERWDGSGYPGGLLGDEIQLAARIVAVADVFDALTQTRPYKQAWPVEEAVGEIARQAGVQFDPVVAEAFSTLDHPVLLGRIRPRQRAAAAPADVRSSRLR